MRSNTAQNHSITNLPQTTLTCDNIFLLVGFYIFNTRFEVVVKLFGAHTNTPIDFSDI